MAQHGPPDEAPEWVKRHWNAPYRPRLGWYFVPNDGGPVVSWPRRPPRLVLPAPRAEFPPGPSSRRGPDDPGA